MIMEDGIRDYASSLPLFWLPQQPICQTTMVWVPVSTRVVQSLFVWLDIFTQATGQVQILPMTGRGIQMPKMRKMETIIPSLQVGRILILKLENHTAFEIVCHISRKKSMALTSSDDEIVITADTMVFLDDKRLGKPKDEADAKRMLTALSGRSRWRWP